MSERARRYELDREMKRKLYALLFLAWMNINDDSLRSKKKQKGRWERRRE